MSEINEQPLTAESFRSSAASRLGPSVRQPKSEPAPASERSDAGPATPADEARSEPPPSHADFTASLRQHTRPAAPSWGWRGRVHRWTGGRISPAVSNAEQDWNAAMRAVQMTFGGPRTIAFVNPKGGAFKTTATLMAARTFGVHRAGGVVAIDNNEARGTLGERSLPAGHTNTARELLDQIDSFDGAVAGVGDLGRFIRGQGPGHFDVLASDERPEATDQLDAASFGRLHEVFRRYYNLVLVDSGNNPRAGNWLAAARQADLVVITTTVREDTAFSALWMADALERHVLEAGALKQRSVALVCAPAPGVDAGLRRFLMETFSDRCRIAMPIPYEPALVGGGQIDFTRLSAATHTAWLYACAAMATTLSPAREG